MMSTERKRLHRARARPRARGVLGVATEVISNQWVSNQFRKTVSDLLSY
jgi:hypothetical protein